MEDKDLIQIVLGMKTKTRLGIVVLLAIMLLLSMAFVPVASAKSNETAMTNTDKQIIYNLDDDCGSIDNLFWG